MQALGGEDMGLDQRVKGLQNRDAGTDLVGEGRDAEIDALPGIAFALAVQGLVLPELLESGWSRAGSARQIRAASHGRVPAVA